MSATRWTRPIRYVGIDMTTGGLVIVGIPEPLRPHAVGVLLRVCLRFADRELDAACLREMDDCVRNWIAERLDDVD